MYPNTTNKIVEKELSYKIVGILFNVHQKLGRYCTERQYADAVENILKEKGVAYEREKPIIVEGRKSSFVDFCIENKILLDAKAKSFITKEDYYQMKRYLTADSRELGLIVNFRQKLLKPKRILNSKPKHNSEHSDKFVV
ncbi:MAG: GxxExxY protein [Patescibacteria group bacterium]